MLLVGNKYHPNDSYCCNELGILFSRKKNFIKAKKWFYEGIKKEPNNLPARNELAKLYFDFDIPKSGLKVLREGLKIDPDNLHFRTTLSKYFLEKQMFNKAQKYLNESIQINKDHFQSYTLLGTMYSMKKEMEKAEFFFNKAIDLFPNGVHSRIELAKLYIQNEKYIEAEDCLNKALLIKPGNVYVISVLSLLYIKSSKLKKAEKVLSKYIIEYPEQEYLLFYLSVLYDKDKLDWKTKREEYLFKLYDINPNQHYTICSISQVFFRFRKHHVRLELLKKHKKNNPKNLIILSELIRVYRKFGDTKNVLKLKGEGEVLLKKYPELEGELEFKTLKEMSTPKRQLVQIGLEGIFQINQIVHKNNVFYITSYPEINNTVKKGDNVKFALFKVRDSLQADFIEPYFENIENLAELK